MSWKATRLKYLCVDSGQYGLNVSAQDYSPTGHRLIRTSDIDENGRLRSKDGAVYVDLPLEPRQEIRRGDLLLSRSGTIGRGMLLGELEESSTYAGYLVRFRPRPNTDPRFMAYIAMSSSFQAAIEADAVTSTIQNFNAERYANISVTVPPLDEQRRIADFLDTETARIDRIISIRRKHLELSEQRFIQIIDGVVMGMSDALTEIGYKGGAISWEIGKVARLFSIVPGFAFPSEHFLTEDEGTRLLRGINVGLGQVDWETEMVSWDLQARPIDQRFHLRTGDLVIGMDRPWIGGGTRVALIREADLPSLLLQRVACIRSRATSTTRYLRWVLGSSHFRSALEGETTGVSVPHISGDQIGSFGFRLPPPTHQTTLAELLDEQDDLRTAQSELIDRQLGLLTERRQALITAAVTGQIDVTTARGLVPAGGGVG